MPDSSEVSNAELAKGSILVQTEVSKMAALGI
jgi:hypothetical protein